jgi:cephalosporin hydroxylase
MNLVDDFHTEFYESGVWAHTYWRGHRIEKFPTDLMAFQEILHEVRPDLIIEAGTRFGGSAVFWGDMCDLMGHGRVVSLDIDAVHTPVHPRVTYLNADSGDPATAALVEPSGIVLVNLDSEHRKYHVLRELAVWAQYVSIGSYLIVEDTNLNGHPIDKQGQPGPWEAVEEWLPGHPEFERDRSREKFLLTANPGGYLKRCT